MERPSRRQFLQGGLALTGLSLLSGCIPPLLNSPQPKIPRLGFLASLVSRSDYGWYDAFHDGLREHEYVDGDTIVVEYRSSEGIPDRLPDLAAELVSLSVDMLVAVATPAVQAAEQASATIPIVFILVADPVE